MARRRPPSRVFFPWERRRGVLGRLGRTRSGLVAALAIVIIALGLVRRREESKPAIRATRAAITGASRAVDRYRADHAGTCPKSLDALVAGHYVSEVPVDAWGNGLRLTCPGRRDPSGFELSSDGPDSLPGGLDQVQ